MFQFCTCAGNGLCRSGDMPLPDDKGWAPYVHRKLWWFLDSLQWRHNERDGVSNHQRLDCLLKRLFRCRSKKTPKLRITGLCEGNPPATGGFLSQRASNAEKASHLMTSSYEHKMMWSSHFKTVAHAHWGRVTHIWVSKLTTSASDNSLSLGRRQPIIWTNAGILLIETLWTKLNEILNEIHRFSFMKRHLKMSSAKWLPFCLDLNVLTCVTL